jgi:hypothetical protein
LERAGAADLHATTAQLREMSYSPQHLFNRDLFAEVCVVNRAAFAALLTVGRSPHIARLAGIDRLARTVYRGLRRGDLFTSRDNLPPGARGFFVRTVGLG